MAACFQLPQVWLARRATIRPSLIRCGVRIKPSAATLRRSSTPSATVLKPAPASKRGGASLRAGSVLMARVYTRRTERRNPAPWTPPPHAQLRRADVGRLSSSPPAGGSCSVAYVTPRQLRHTCATLLLNAGAPPAIVQAILGHKHIDTTMNYARLYDSTVATDYFGAMDEIEARMELAEAGADRPISGGQLLALVDTLREGTLNHSQQQTVLQLRAGILAFVAQEPELA